MYKGVKKNQNYTWLICAAQNMKNIAIKNDNVGKIPNQLSYISSYFIKNIKKFVKKQFKKLYIRKPLKKIRGLSTVCKKKRKTSFFIHYHLI